MHFLFTSLLITLPFALAREGGQNVSRTAVTSVASTSSSTKSIQTVAVGKGGLNFTPNSFTAAVGSQVEFVFYPSGHSVAQSSFDHPCAPLNSRALYSGSIAVSGSGPSTTTFTITVNDTKPLWFYCGVPTHCQKGMAGVINPPSNTSQSLAVYQAAAAKVLNTTTPSTVQGGIFSTAANVSVNGSSTTTSFSTATSSGTTTTSTAKASSTTSKSGAVGNTIANFEWFGMGLASMMVSVFGILI